ncbi:PH domain-containing protein [Paraburkholderia tuberum]|uniref:PH domain-containing protein n=1 Tax=Paraburkholderia tuberum TaxID=157910 RepID=A0A1H1FSG0_9BURK|nr:PH domain-containing protein [Paraburkholderia tuberum]SDR03932.1 PH domain-containing protein [Paraburkholderia tuberum]
MFDFKNASKQELKAEYNRIAREIGDDQFFTKKELNHLPEILMDGEQVLAFASGVMDNSTWLIALTDHRVIFLDKGLLFGLKQVSINLDKINAVSGSTGLVFGTIRIEDAASERVIRNVRKQTVAGFTNKVRDALNVYRRPAPVATPSETAAVQTDDIVSKLERLAVLRERGALTEAEFVEQKTRVLAQ